LPAIFVVKQHIRGLLSSWSNGFLFSVIAKERSDCGNLVFNREIATTPKNTGVSVRLVIVFSLPDKG